MLGSPWRPGIARAQVGQRSPLEGGPWVRARPRSPFDCRPPESPRMVPPVRGTRAPSLLQALGIGAALLAVATLPAAAGCKSTPSAGSSASPVGAVALAPERVAPEYRDDLKAVQEAQAEDPAGPAVVSAADRLLARDPPLNLRLAAIHAKVAHAYLNGDDAIALRWAEDILGATAGGEGSMDEAEVAILRDVDRLRVLLLARSGEPDDALKAIERAERAKTIPSGDLWAARALAHERGGARVDAAFDLAMWRAEVADASSEARYAEARIGELLAGAEPAALVVYAQARPGTAGARCLLTRAGQADTAAAEAWLGACAPQPVRIGALLPRTGKLAALADDQLAAAIAAVEVLAATNPAVEVVWADAGSTPETAKRGAEELLERGVGVVVGPIGAANVAAAERVLAGEAAVIVPGEGRATAVGIAPSLEARIRALVEHAKQSGAKGIVILAPAHGYGTRATAAARAAADKLGVPIVDTGTYEESTTSFAPVVRPVVPSLRKGAALLVLDRVARMELLLRQLAREGLTAGGGNNTKSATIMTTAEALSLAELNDRRTILEGVWMAPVAWPDAATEAFAAAYRAHEGEDPGDQALLVFRAFARAWQGGAGEPFSATVVRVQGGRIVAPPAEVSLTPEG
ncbi:MAG: ABC transporter substrate-binding protein [Nannocystaceae bacterium]